MQEFKERIKILREKRGMSYSQFAALYDKSEGAIRAWETGRTKPDADTLIKISDDFNVSTDYLLGKSEAKTPENEAIISKLGISDEAIETIKECVQRGLDINRLLSTPGILALLIYLTAYWEAGNTELFNDPKNKFGMSFHESIEIPMRRKIIRSEIIEIIDVILGHTENTHGQVKAAEWAKEENSK